MEASLAMAWTKPINTCTLQFSGLVGATRNSNTNVSILMEPFIAKVPPLISLEGQQRR